ncbi:hypothetical protein QUA54_18595 [Microcoleus sp. MOSTC5]|uniref:hypothetical protein n=1 Tax=Microcoleus sp. MOSTC5 TaxID=3055378 RepID=UPI002FD7214E
MSGEAEVNHTTRNSGASKGKEATSEVPKVDKSNTLSFTSRLPEQEHSKALAALLLLLSTAQISSGEVICLMPQNPERVLWLGIKLLDKNDSDD